MRARVLPLLPVVVVALVALLPAAGALASSPPRWGEPVQLGAELPSSWFPDIDADPTGRVRLVWSASLVEGDLNASHEIAGAVMVSELGEGGWSAPADIFVMDGGIASRPLIASDGRWAHLLFRYAVTGEPVHMMYSRAPLQADLASTRAWSRPVALSADESYWGQIRVLPDGSLLAIYNQITSVPVGEAFERRTALFSRRSSDDGVTWSPAVRISAGPERVARTALAVSADGATIVAAWDEGYDNLTATGDPAAVATAASHDGGASWSAPVSVAGAFEQAAVAIGRDGPLLVFRSNEENVLLYRTSADGGLSWSDAAEIPGAETRPYGSKHNFDKLSLAVDGDGRVLLAWVGPDEDAPEGLAVFVSSFAGGEWSAPDVVARPDGFPEYPRLAVALGNRVELAWFVRDKEFDVGHYTLWTASGTSDAQPLAPAVVEPAPVAVTAEVEVTPPQLATEPAPPEVAPPANAGELSPTPPQDVLARPLATIAGVTALALGVVLALFISLRLLRQVTF